MSGLDSLASSLVPCSVRVELVETLFLTQIMRPGTLVPLLKYAAQRWLDRDAFQHAGALGFCTLFSLAPLVIILVAVVGAVYGQEAASGNISAAISGLVGPQAASAVEEAVRRSRVEEAGIVPTRHAPMIVANVSRGTRNVSTIT